MNSLISSIRAATSFSVKAEPRRADDPDDIIVLPTLPHRPSLSNTFLSAMPGGEEGSVHSRLLDNEASIGLEDRFLVERSNRGRPIPFATSEAEPQRAAEESVESEARRLSDDEEMDDGVGAFAVSTQSGPRLLSASAVRNLKQEETTPRFTDAIAEATALAMADEGPTLAEEHAAIRQVFADRTASGFGQHCPGCTSFQCAIRMNIFDIHSWSEEGVCDYFKNHGCVFPSHPCRHRASTGDMAYVLHNPPGTGGRSNTCPFPRCERKPSPFAPLVEGVCAKGGRGSLQERLFFALLFCAGIPHVTMRNSFGFTKCPKIQTAWRNSIEEIMAASHAIDIASAQNTVRYGQFDEVCIGTRKYNRGEAVSQNDQMWFQTCVVTDGPQVLGQKRRVLAFYVRYVTNRTRETLVGWITSLVCDGAEIATDSWRPYNSIEKACREAGKNVKVSAVNHTHMFATHTGVHTNAVEGLHMHLKQFLRKFSRIGCDRILRINRVIAAAVMSNPKHSATNSRMQKLLHAFRTVAQYNVPAEAIVADFRTKAFIGPFLIVKETSDGLVERDTEIKIVFSTRVDRRAEFEDHERREEERRATAEAAAKEAAKKSAKAQKKLEKAREALRDNQRKQEAADALAANSAQKVERAEANLLAIQRAERGEAAQPHQKKRRMYN